MAGKRKVVAPAGPALAWSKRLERLGRRLLTHLILPILVPVALITLALVALYGLQAALRARTNPILTPFADIQCDPPPGLSRAEFLQEVAFLADLPALVDLLDSERLAAAFVRHPWVESVASIAPTPERRLRVVLVYRVPVLVVWYRARPWVVDGRAILLPEKAPLAGLPGCGSDVPPHRGAVWPDARVVACARVAGYLHPYQDRLNLAQLSCEPRGVLLSTTWQETIVWGNPPGVERADERAAALKLQRLLARRLPGISELDLRH